MASSLQPLRVTGWLLAIVSCHKLLPLGTKSEARSPRSAWVLVAPGKSYALLVVVRLVLFLFLFLWRLALADSLELAS